MSNTKPRTESFLGMNRLFLIRPLPCRGVSSGRAWAAVRNRAHDLGGRTQGSRSAGPFGDIHLWDRRIGWIVVKDAATLVSRLRATFGPELIIGGRSGYRSGETASVDLYDAFQGSLLAEPG